MSFTIETGMSEEAQKIMQELKTKVFFINEWTESKQMYQSLVELVYNYVSQGFEWADFREHPVYFKFFNREDEPVHVLELRHFLTNVIMWEPMSRLEKWELINSSYIVDCTKISADLIQNYINLGVVIPFRKEFSNKKMNKVIHDMIHNLLRISCDFNMLLGLSINAETFMSVAEQNPRFDEIIRTKINDNMQPTEIETHLDALMDEEIEILKTHPNFLQPMLMSGAGIKHKQLAEFSINGGMKPDLHDNTIPIPINSNFIVGGLGSVTNYFLDSLGGRKAAIMNNTVMGKSGHFSRMVMLLVSDIKLQKKGELSEDCGTVYGVEIEIKTNAHLKKLAGRFYRELYSREYKVIKGTEKYLIGRKIILRSPITCAGEKLCKKCYGEVFYTNISIKSVGGFAGTQITNPLSQNILSSKHLLTTQSEEIKFSEAFYKFFTIKANEILLNNDTDDDIDIAQYSLVIVKENIISIDQFDDNDYNSYVLVYHIKHRKTGETFEIKELNGGELYISEELHEVMSKDRSGSKSVHEIPLTSLSYDDKLFVMEVTNNELTKPLYSIMNLLDRVDHEGCTTIDQMAQRLLDLIIESKFSAHSVHAEILIKPLIRCETDILKTPNFRSYVDGTKYRILTIKSALQNHPSVLISLAFQDLLRQLVRPVTFRKSANSFTDPFFKERP